MLQRTLGRGVPIVSSGEAIAHQVERALGARGLANPTRRGRLPLPVDRRRRGVPPLGTRFLQMPLGPSSTWRQPRQRRPHEQRNGGRGPDDLRPITIEPGFVRTATGSALICVGETRVICTASIEGVPRWMAGRAAAG